MWKFKRWKIKWNPKKRKFQKKKRDRKVSRDAHMRYLTNKSAIKMGLRKSRIKGRIQMKKNKAMGMYKKLAVARKRHANILKSDINLDMFFDQMLHEGKYIPEVEIGDEDLEHMIYNLKQIERNVEMETKEEQEEFEQYVDDIITTIKALEDADELTKEDEEFLSEILSLIEEFGAEAGLIDDTDEKKKEDE